MGVRSTCRAVSRHWRKDQTMIGDRITPQRLSIRAASQYLVREFERPRVNNILAVD